MASRDERIATTYTRLHREAMEAFERSQMFWCSHAAQRHYESCERKRAAYDAKYGPFEVVTNA